MVSTGPCQAKIGLKISIFLDPLDLDGYGLPIYPEMHSKLKPVTTFMAKSHTGKASLIGRFKCNFAANFLGNLIIFLEDGALEDDAALVVINATDA